MGRIRRGGDFDASPRRGGVTIKALQNRKAEQLLRYRDDFAEEDEGYLITSANHCSDTVGLQIEEFADTRKRYGTDHAKKRAAGRYREVDQATGLGPEGQQPTHIKYFDGTRNRKRKALDGETATHYYEPPSKGAEADASEAVHFIYACADDLVNPENSEDMHRFFEAVCAYRDERYPGIQESRWLERNGKSGLAHVHIASNATIYEGFERDGVQYSAGQKMAGALTGIHHVRGDFEQWLDAHQEYGFTQRLSRVGTKEYWAAQKRDGQKSYWDRTRGEESAQDRIRRSAVEVLQADGVDDRESFIKGMKERGITVDEVGLRRGKPTKSHDYRYRIDGAKQVVRGRTLGTEYGFATIGSQLDRKASGQAIEVPELQRAGEAKPLPFEQPPQTPAEQEEYDQLVADVESMAGTERERQEADRKFAEWKTQQDDLWKKGRDGDQSKKQNKRVNEMRERQLAQASAMQEHVDASLKALEDDIYNRSQPEEQSASETPAAEEHAEDSGEQSEQKQPLSFVMEGPRPEPYRSKLRGTRSKSEKQQKRIDGLVALDERWHDSLPQTPEDRREFEQEVRQFGGVGSKVLASAEGRIDPALHSRLTERVEQANERRASFERRKELREMDDQLVRAAKNDPFDEHGAKSKLNESHLEARFLDKHIERVDADRKGGDYTSRAQEYQDFTKQRAWARHEAKVAGMNPSSSTRDLQAKQQARNERLREGKGQDQGLQME